MTNSGIIFISLLIINLVFALAYLLWWLVFKKDRDNRKQYIMNTVIMLLCPIIGVFYFLFAHLKYRFIKIGNKDLSDVEFSKERHVARLKADEQRERNVVSVGEAILVSDKEKKRANMLNVLLGETDESFAAIALALDSDDSEVAHYAASFLQSKMDTFRDNVRKTQKMIESDDIDEKEQRELILKLIRYMNHMLKQNVFTRIEQSDYVAQMEKLCETLFCDTESSLPHDCYEGLIGRKIELEDYDKAEFWGDRYFAQYPDILSAYTLRMKLYFETGHKDKFFEVLSQLQRSSVSIDSQTLELIRMVRQ